MASYINVPFLFLSLLLFEHDREVIEKYEAAGLFDNFEENEEEIQVVDVREDGTRTYTHGLRVVDNDADMDRVRLIRATLDNSVQSLYGKNDEVTAWADSLGGLRAVQERLIGLKLSNGSWYKKTLRRLRQDLGYDPSPLGDPTNEVQADSATGYTSYAVQVHRDLVTKKAYGEVEDDDTTTPNWAMSEFDFDYKGIPWWWKLISMGRKPIYTEPGEYITSDDSNYRWGLIKSLTHGERTRVPKWRPNLCFGPNFGAAPFQSLYKVYSEAAIDRDLTVKEFTWRFYNDPQRLSWKKVAIANRDPIWMAGMRTPKGLAIWCPVTVKSSKTIDYYTDGGTRAADGWFDWSKTAEVSRGMIRALYVTDKDDNEWVIPYKKARNEEGILVAKLKSNSQTGTWEVWMKKLMTPYEWGSAKKKILAMGGKDAYFGRPWKKYEPKTQQNTESL